MEAGSEKDELGVVDFLSQLPFVLGLGISVVTAAHGKVTVEMPFSSHISSAPDHFPASMVGAIGDVAAISACLTMVPGGWAVSTLDFTIKMTNPAKGALLRATGVVLQSGRTISTAKADIWAIDVESSIHCGTVLATGRNFPVR
jgi:uncharacterized protein (TIGR00369 family)